MTDRSARTRAVAAREGLYDQIAREFGLLSVEEADQRLGSSAATARSEGRLLGLERPRGVFPGFQFDGAGVRPLIAELIALGADYGRTEAGLIQWLVAPTTYLHGKRPVDVIDDPKKLLDVAGRSFGVVW